MVCVPGVDSRINKPQGKKAVMEVNSLTLDTSPRDVRAENRENRRASIELGTLGKRLRLLVDVMESHAETPHLPEARAAQEQSQRAGSPIVEDNDFMNALVEDVSPMEMNSPKVGDGRDDRGDLWNYSSHPTGDPEPEQVVAPAEGSGLPQDRGSNDQAEENAVPAIEKVDPRE